MKITREYKRNLEQDNWFYVELGKRLKQARYTKVNEFTGKEYVVTQTAVAKSVNTSFQQIQKYEKGINRIPIISLVKIAKFLKKPLNYFLDIHEPNEELQAAYRDAMNRLSENV